MRFLLMFLLCITLGMAASGQGKLIIQGKSPFWYVVHTMTAGETFAGVAKKYGVTTDYLRQYNNLQQGYLLAGTKIKIPIRNLTKLHKDGVPVYYQIKKGDNLYQIGQQFNKVSLDFLKNWNNIKEEDAREGLEIIVGYIGGYQPIESRSEQNFTAVDAKATGGIEIKGVMKPRGQEKEKEVPRPIDESRLGEELYIKEEPVKRKELAPKQNPEPAHTTVIKANPFKDNPSAVVQQQIGEQKQVQPEKAEPSAPKPAAPKTAEPVAVPVVKNNPPLPKKDSVQMQVNKPAVLPQTPLRRDSSRKATNADITVLSVSQAKIVDTAAKIVRKDTVQTIKQAPLVKKDSIASVAVKPMLVAKPENNAQTAAKPLLRDSVVDAPMPAQKKDTVAVAKKEMPLPPLEPKPSSALEEGFFAQQYAVQTTGLQLKVQTMESSIFKTMTGWDDKKYYVLANGVPEGTIVRLTANNKSVCAKVLGSLPVMKGDNGLQLRVSNAAAAALGLEANRFQLMVTYFQ
jgi:LysM repeat protein